MLKLCKLLLLIIITFGCNVNFACQQFTYDHEQARKILGYDPDIKLYADDSEASDAHPTIYVHGFGDNGQGFYSWKEFEGCVHNPSIFFNLPDYNLQSNNFAIFESSFGQWSAIAPTLYVLKQCRDAGHKRVDLFGFSAGAATIINLLDVLHNKKYSSPLRILGPSLQQLGIDEQARIDILNMIQAGCITLDSPIKHLYPIMKNMIRTVRVSIINMIKRFFGHHQGNLQNQTDKADSVSSRVGCCLDNIGAAVMNYAVLPLISKYKPWRESPIYSAKRLQGLKLNVLLNFEKNDQVVTNFDNRQLYRAFHDLNPASTYCVQSDDGGHCAPRTILPGIIKAFKSLHGYCRTSLDKNDAEAMLECYKIDPKKVRNS
jgi:hypothetical protein